MSSGKGSTPAAPNYTPIAQADQQAAQQQYQLGQQELNQSQSNFNQIWPYAQSYLQSTTAAEGAQTKAAQGYQSFYDNTVQPMEQNFDNTASNYNSPAQANLQAGTAMADVSNTMNQSRNQTMSNLESYGIDPSQTRFGALDLGASISQAAATAAAGTQSRLNTQATGLALQGEGINMGLGLPNDVAGAYSTATNAGGAGLNGANSTSSIGLGGYNAASGIYGQGVNSNSAAASALNMGFGDSLQADQLGAQENGNFMSGLGSLVGGGAALAFL